MKKISSIVISVVALAMIGLSCSHYVGLQTHGHELPATGPSSVATAETAAAELTKRLKALCDSAGGDVGVAVVHVETGRAVDIEGAKKLPLYSVFKLPLAIVVLKEIEEKRLQLDRKVRVTPEDVAPGSQFNKDLWRRPVDKTVAELIEVSIVRSDNTSTDKLLALVGGPAELTERLRSFGFSNIDVVVNTREFAAHRDKPNTGTATDLARLLVALQKNELLQQTNSELLLGFMTRSMTGGERRLRADLPASTPVADKTGSGPTTTNDVGIITLPEGKGHLAIAVLINGSKLTIAAQEKLAAELARAAYDSFVSAPLSH